MEHTAKNSKSEYRTPKQCSKYQITKIQNVVSLLCSLPKMLF